MGISPSLPLPLPHRLFFKIGENAYSCIATRVNWKEAWKAQSPGFTEWKTAVKEPIRPALVKDLEHLDCPLYTFEQPPLPFLLSPILCISSSTLPLFLCHFFLTFYCSLFSVSFGFSWSRVKLHLSFAREHGVSSLWHRAIPNMFAVQAYKYEQNLGKLGGVSKVKYSSRGLT